MILKKIQNYKVKLIYIKEEVVHQSLHKETQ